MARKGEPPVVSTCTPRGTRRAGASGGHAPPLLGPRRGPNYGAAWPSSKFSESRKKRVVLPADAGRAEQANDERAGLVQDARGKMETDADVVRLQAEQMIGAAGAPSHVTAERRLKDNGLTAVRRPLCPRPRTRTSPASSSDPITGRTPMARPGAVRWHSPRPSALAPCRRAAGWT